MNLMHLGSQTSRSQHESGLLCDIDYIYTSFKSILDDMMLMSHNPEK